MVKPNHPVPRREQPKVPTLYDALEYARSQGYEFDGDPDPYAYGAELEQTYGIDLINPEWKSSPDDDKWVERFRSRGRKAIIAMLMIKGYSENQISKRIGVSEVVVRRDLEAIHREWRQRYLGLHEDRAVLALAKLDYMLTRLMPAIDSGDPQAVRAAAELIKIEGNMIGFNQGIQMDAEIIVRQAAEAHGLDPDRAVEIATKVSMHLKT